jgi:hypothetical protein
MTIFSHEETQSRICLPTFSRFKEAKPLSWWGGITEKGWFKETGIESG